MARGAEPIPSPCPGPAMRGHEEAEDVDRKEVVGQVIHTKLMSSFFAPAPNK